MNGNNIGGRMFWFLLYLVFGLYFINKPFQVIGIPESFAGTEEWIIFVGGLLLVWGAINVLRIARLKQPRLF